MIHESTAFSVLFMLDICQLGKDGKAGVSRQVVESGCSMTESSADLTCARQLFNKDMPSILHEHSALTEKGGLY